MKVKYSKIAQLKEASRLNDEYLRKENAVEEYRCRSAYKLLEINQRYKIFRPDQTVVDLGCAPGSWTQVAVRTTRSNEMKSNSLIVGIDLKEIQPIEGAHLISGLDFELEESQEKITQALRGRQVDLVLSDMAPNTTGNRFVDHVNVSNLCFAVLKFVQAVCTRGAMLVMKVFDGEDCKQLIKDTRYLFESVKVVHPKATRRPSSEMFYVGFRYKNNKLPEDE